MSETLPLVSPRNLRRLVLRGLLPSLLAGLVLLAEPVLHPSAALFVPALFLLPGFVEAYFRPRSVGPVFGLFVATLASLVGAFAVVFQARYTQQVHAGSGSLELTILQDASALRMLGPEDIALTLALGWGLACASWVRIQVELSFSGILWISLGSTLLGALASPLLSTHDFPALAVAFLLAIPLIALGLLCGALLPPFYKRVDSWEFRHFPPADPLNEHLP